MVRNIFKGKSDESATKKVEAASIPVTRTDTANEFRPAATPPTLLSKERDALTAAMRTLHELQSQIHNQNAVVAHLRENINTLECNPWFQDLYMELRRREFAAGTMTRGTFDDFTEAIKRSTDCGLIAKQEEPGAVK